MGSAQGFRLDFVDDTAFPLAFGFILEKQFPGLLVRHVGTLIFPSIEESAALCCLIFPSLICQSSANPWKG